jgi:hypothetical protein
MRKKKRKKPQKTAEAAIRKAGGRKIAPRTFSAVGAVKKLRKGKK